MSDLIQHVSALARPSDRDQAAASLARVLGGRDLLVLLLDPDVGVYLPAPGFPQTLADARSWKRVVEACASAGEASAPHVGPADGPPCPVYAVKSGGEAILAVIGTMTRPAAMDDLLRLLPLLTTVLQFERRLEYASSRERVALQAAAHAERLAAAFDQSRFHLQRALASAEQARGQLAEANARLTEQAAELEVQSEELAAQAEELQTLNVELEEARDTAEAANRAKSEFLATMSHELRTPLNAISGHLQLLVLGIYGMLTEEQLGALRRIDRSQRHLLGLINDILNLARIEAGRVEYRLEPIRVADLLADLAPMIEPQIRAKGLQYGVSVSAPALTAYADREKTQQILLNLLSNATKFTPSGGSIEVSCFTEPRASDTIFLRVADTGIGIPDDKLSSIFEPFVQVNSGHTRPVEGTGLGLAISRDLARGMGGDLRARSTLDRGSAFTLSLPNGSQLTTPASRVDSDASAVLQRGGPTD